jgi:hypothetical protein
MVHTDHVPVLGTGKTDYVKVQKTAEASLATVTTD